MEIECLHTVNFDDEWEKRSSTSGRCVLCTKVTWSAPLTDSASSKAMLTFMGTNDDLQGRRLSTHVCDTCKEIMSYLLYRHGYLKRPAAAEDAAEASPVGAAAPAAAHTDAMIEGHPSGVKRAAAESPKSLAAADSTTGAAAQKRLRIVDVPHAASRDPFSIDVKIGGTRQTVVLSTAQVIKVLKSAFDCEPQTLQSMLYQLKECGRGGRTCWSSARE